MAGGNYLTPRPPPISSRPHLTAFDRPHPLRFPTSHATLPQRPMSPPLPRKERPHAHTHAPSTKSAKSATSAISAISAISATRAWSASVSLATPATASCTYCKIGHFGHIHPAKSKIGHSGHCPHRANIPVCLPGISATSATLAFMPLPLCVGHNAVLQLNRVIGQHSAGAPMSRWRTGRERRAPRLSSRPSGRRDGGDAAASA
ncbi:MAG: hypothetical protein OJF49_002504 [Ktedonobacterales bacterium]|nr:MAG: hypothetical protein OJF49_002504 [Ktedonobacterales bacterium]